MKSSNREPSSPRTLIAKRWPELAGRDNLDML